MRYRWARWTLLVPWAVAAAVSVCVWALDLERQLRVERAAWASSPLPRRRRAGRPETTCAGHWPRWPPLAQAAVGWSRRAAAAIDEPEQMTGLPVTVTPGAAAGPRDGDVFDAAQQCRAAGARARRRGPA